MKKKLIIASISILIASPIAAQNASVISLIDEAINTCVDGSNGEQLNKLALSWGAVGHYTALFSQEKAINCFADYRGIDAEIVFLPDRGSYVVASSIGRETSIQRQRRLEQEALERQNQRRIREAANIEAVNGKVYRACLALAEQDQIAAYTNQLCVSSFKSNGDPS